MRAYLRAEFLYKVEFLTRPGAAAALPSSLTAGRPGLRLFAPPPRPAVAAPARHRRAGSWGRRAASLRPTPARPRAPLAAVGGKARANNRGLARNCKETEPVMEEFSSGEKENSATLGEVRVGVGQNQPDSSDWISVYTDIQSTAAPRSHVPCLNKNRGLKNRGLIFRVHNFM